MNQGVGCSNFYRLATYWVFVLFCFPLLLIFCNTIQNKQKTRLPIYKFKNLQTAWYTVSAKQFPEWLPSG